METVDSNPLVTVIIPVYNTEPYLRKCLDSVCGQTYGNLEIICVNDGSTDGSQAILNEYAARDARVKVLVQENAGQAAARNRALDIATGDWISCIDSDDWIDSNTYEELLKVGTLDIDVICFDAQIEGGDREANSAITKYHTSKYEGTHEVKEEHILNTSATVSTKFIRNKCIQKYGICFPEGKKYEDTAFFYCLMMVAKRVKYMKNHRYYHYFQRSGSTMYATYAKTPMAMHQLDNCELFRSFAEKHGVMEPWQHAFLSMFEKAYNFSARYSPTELLPNIKVKAYRMARKWGLVRRHDLAFIQEIRQHNRSCIEKIFHSCHPNRDSFGIGGCSILSIVHTPTEDIFYLCGKKLFTRKVRR